MTFHSGSKNGRRWIVINQRTGASRYPFQHLTLEAAQKEAARVSRADPGARVWVLETIGFCIKRDVDWVPAEGAAPSDLFDDEIPF